MSWQPTLTADKLKLNEAWEEHLRAEFKTHSADEAIATMVANPLVKQVPVMIGGNGKEELHEFYARYFLPRSRQIMRWFRCRGPSAKGGWSMRWSSGLPTQSRWVQFFRVPLSKGWAKELEEFTEVEPRWH
jgi:hypothetical protein